MEHPIERIEDDRASLRLGDLSLLIVEDDPHYARVLADLARDNGFKVIVCSRGAEALILAREYRPTAISLDVFLRICSAGTSSASLSRIRTFGISRSRSSRLTRINSMGLHAAPIRF